MLHPAQTRYRTHEAGALRLAHCGQTVRLCGWVHAIRRYRRQAFVELRESSGLVQLVVPVHLAAPMTVESAITVEGVVQARLQSHPNLLNYPTGEVEVVVGESEILGLAAALPFSHHETPSEAEMLRHRTLALRWPAAQTPLRQRAAMVRALRQVAEHHELLEVETPVLVRNTPGGAAPFLVPVSEGKGYALAQSPQIWKQLLVCGGIEGYYQLAHCFRNEGARPERQPEFSQFEIELAFATQQSVQVIMEKMACAAAQALGISLAAFPRMTYFQAMQAFGSENPHLGNPLRLVSPLATPETRFNPAVVEFALPPGCAMTREEERAWLQYAWRAIGEHGVIDLERGVFRATGALEPCQKALGGLMSQVASAWGLMEPGIHPLWVEQMPLFEHNEHGELVSAHHPFTRPLPGHEALVSTHPTRVLGEAFDLVINGVEVGGGSMRIHEHALQSQVFSALGWSSEAPHHFAPLLEALEMGAPPHGGMALGVERLLACLLGLPHIRPTMAFPKTAGGQCLLTQALS